MRGLVLVAVVCGCGRIGFDPRVAGGGDDGAGSDARGPGSGSGSDDAAVIGGDADPDGGGVVGTGSGTISGTAPDGKPFTTIVAGYIIGHPKYPGETSIYMFSNPIKCSDLGFPGWGSWITAGTQSMEIQLPTAAAGTYPVLNTEPPAAPNGFSQYRYGEGGGGEITGFVSGGQIVVTDAGASSISGNFNVAFVQNGPLVGTFTAVSCPTGYYPTFP